MSEAEAVAPTAASASGAGNVAVLPETQDALQLLRADHRRIDALLLECERLTRGGGASPADVSGLLGRLGALLLAHAQVEQELFYPLLQGLGVPTEGALHEHAQIEALLGQLSSQVQQQGGEFNAHLAALALHLREHVAEEEHELFAQADHMLDRQALGERLAVRRAELLGDQGED